MIELGQFLPLERCPHCQTDIPTLKVLGGRFHTFGHGSTIPRYWSNFCCSRCGGVVLAESYPNISHVAHIYPTARTVHNDLPERAKAYLQQAIGSLSAPAGAVMLCASAVDAMLKAKNLNEGSLYKRIEQAVKTHLITQEMGDWAHEVRLDANDQRHADSSHELPTTEDAEKLIDFVEALGTFLFVLPSRVARGIQSAKSEG